MTTTFVYFELIAIGLHASAWMALLVACLIGRSVGDVIDRITHNAAIIALLIGVFYLLGLYIDRAADLLFQRWEKKWKQGAGMDAIVRIDREEQYNYTRSVKRVLRASCVNMPMLLVTGLWYVAWRGAGTGFLWKMLCLVGLGGGFFCFLSFWSYRSVAELYYERAKTLNASKSEKKP